MSWNCEQIEARLSDYVDQLLSLEEQLEFTAHAAACPQCKPLVAQVSGLVVQMRRLEPVEEPPQLMRQILEQTLGPRKVAKGWRAALEWLRPVVQPRFAMGLATAVLAVMVVSPALGIQWSKVDWRNDLTPANLYRNANSQAHLIYARGVKFVNDMRVVHEIQSRLQQQQDVQPPPQEQQPRAPGSTEAEPKRDRDINRARELKPIPIMLASAVGGLPGRSNP